MVYDRRFRPQGNAVLVAASSSTASTPTSVSTGGVGGVFVSNPSTNTQSIFVALGTSSVQAAVPTTAVPCAGMCILPGEAYLLDVSPSTSRNFLSAATSAGSALLFAQPGDNI